MTFDIKSVFQRNRNERHITEAAVQVEREEKQPDHVYTITNLIKSIADRLPRGDRTIPWPLSGSDKPIHYAGYDRPGYFMAAKAPDTLIFLTLDDNGKGILVNKPDFYDPSSTKLNLEKIRDQRLLSDIVIRLRQILAIPHDDFNTIPREGWSSQIHP